MQNTKNSRFFPVPLVGKVREAGKGVVKEKSLFNNPLSAFAATSPAGGEGNGGFTLIELLVVVLIIGILAAVAVPQYQVAVAKAQLAKYLPLVKTIYTAEEAFFLANGEYTLNLKELDIETPFENCRYGQTARIGAYTCPDVAFGVYNGATNVQVQTHNIGYLQYFTEEENANIDENLKKGDVVCMSGDDTAKKVCRSLGPIKKEKEVAAGPWTYMVILQ